jgi:hypothetical protein
MRTSPQPQKSTYRRWLQGAGMMGRGYGMHGANFIDENGNGICDWLEQ